MTHLCCTHCRLRFAPAAGAYLVACPECGEPPVRSALEDVLGFRMFSVEDLPFALPEAIAASLPIPESHERDRE